MKKEYLNNYFRVVMNFAKHYELLNQGVLELAIQDNEEIYNKVSHLEDSNYRFTEKEVVILVTRYNQLNKIYKERFKIIFTKCLDYNPLESTLNMYLGGVKPWTRSVLSISNEDFSKLVEKTKYFNTRLSSIAFSEYIKLDDGKTLDDLIEDCSRNAY